MNIWEAIDLFHAKNLQPVSKETTPRTTEFDQAYMKVAYIFAELSYAQRLQVGAIIVKDRQILAEGYNGSPSGFPNQCELEDGKTSELTIHAEQNALIKMAKSSNSTVGATLYVTHSPCQTCAKLIYQAGIERVVYCENYKDLSGINFLIEAGIDVVRLEGEFF